MKSQTDFQLDTETILPKYIELWIPKTSSDRNSGIILKPFFSLQGCVYPSNGNSQYCLRSKYFHSTQFCCGDVKCALRLPDISSIYNWVMIFLTELWWREQIKWRNVFCLFGFALPFRCTPSFTGKFYRSWKNTERISFFMAISYQD